MVAEIRRAGGRAEKVRADLASKDGPHKLANQVRGMVAERLDILVANAGISSAAPIEQTTVEDFDKLYAVNVRAPYFLVQQLLPAHHVQARSITPVHLLRRTRRWAASLGICSYGAVATLVKYFAVALGPKGIRVNAVAPGVVETDMLNFTE